MIQKVIIYLEHLGEVKAHAYAKPGVKNLNIKKALLKKNYCQLGSGPFFLAQVLTMEFV